MRRRKDAHMRPHDDAVPDGDEPAVEDAEVEVRVEAGADGDVGAVVYLERGLDVGLIVGDVT